MINLPFSITKIFDNFDILFFSVKELLQEKRWFTQKHKKVSSIATEDYAIFEERGILLFAVLLNFYFEGSPEKSKESFFIPYALIPEADYILKNVQAVKITFDDGIYYLVDGEMCRQYHRFLQDAMASCRMIRTKKGLKLSFSYTHGKKFNFIKTEPLQQPSSNVLSIWTSENDKYILKSYRKFTCNPEPEMLGVLGDGKFNNIPIFTGIVKYVTHENTFYPAILFKYIDNKGCASNLFSHNLSKRLKEAEQNGYDTKNGTLEIEKEIKKITHVLASFHKTLAASDQQGFGTEKISAADIANWQQSSIDMEERLESILEQEGCKHDRFCKLIALYREACHSFGGIRDMLLKPCGIDKSRIHQDMHLDQLLMANNSFYIIDLEGEPMRSGEEKFEKVHPLRDVAGICRSLGYVKHFTLLSILSKNFKDISIGDISSILLFGTLSTLGKDRDIQLLANVCNAWEKEVLSLFIKSYFNSLNVEYFEECANHVGYWMFEKALYELFYEFGNRPENISIPIEGVLRICSLFKNNKFELLSVVSGVRHFS